MTMIDHMILESHVPLAVNQAIARELGLKLMTNGRQTIAARELRKGFELVRSGYKRIDDMTPEAA